jgi:hypothetical protein
MEEPNGTDLIVNSRAIVIEYSLLASPIAKRLQLPIK